MYLHHQWSDEAHTLQFCSTGEYFETVEYELHRTLGARDSWWFVPNSQVCSSPHTSPVGEFISNLGGIFNFRRIDLKTQKSDFLKKLFLIRIIVCILWKNLFGDDLSVLKSIKLKVSKNYRFLRRAEDHLPGERDFGTRLGFVNIFWMSHRLYKHIFWCRDADS